MTHHDYQVLLSSFADGELTSSDEKTFVAHLETCNECRTVLKEMRRVRKDLRAVGDVELSHRFADDVIRSIHHKDREAVSWLGVEHSAQRAFFALAVLAFLFMFLTSFNQMNQSLPAESLLTPEPADSLAAQVLLKQGEISREDVFLAVVAK